MKRLVHNGLSTSHSYTYSLEMSRSMFLFLFLYSELYIILETLTNVFICNFAYIKKKNIRDYFLVISSSKTLYNWKML